MGLWEGGVRAVWERGFRGGRVREVEQVLASVVYSVFSVALEGRVEVGW